MQQHTIQSNALLPPMSQLVRLHALYPARVLLKPLLSMTNSNVAFCVQPSPKNPAMKYSADSNIRLCVVVRAMILLPSLGYR